MDTGEALQRVARAVTFGDAAAGLPNGGSSAPGLVDEANVLAAGPLPRLRPAKALDVVKRIGSLAGVASAEAEKIRAALAGTLSRDWPSNAEELGKAIAADLNDTASLMGSLPEELGSHPRVTSAALEHFEDRYSRIDVAFWAKTVRLDEQQARSALHGWTRMRDGPLKNTIGTVLARSSAPPSWRAVQLACLGETGTGDLPEPIRRGLEALPMRHSQAFPTFDMLGATPEVQAAWRSGMVRAAGGDAGLRAALLEAVLWHGSERADELVLSLAAELCDCTKDRGRTLLDALARHPSNAVHLRVAALLARLDDTPLEPSAPPALGLLGATARLAALPGGPSGGPLTWIGDRRIETMLHRAIQGAAADFVGSYEAHWREDEEPLAVKLLGGLRAALDLLEADVSKLGQATGAKRRIGFRLRDRIVSKIEEGQEGLASGRAFATDVCLVMTARVEGRVLANRATLVQVKKLKKDKNDRWNPSFPIDKVQLDAAADQTASAVYLLLCPEEGARTLPVMPARLVQDILPSGGKTRSLHRDHVSRSSRSLAQWLTYDVIGLWSGDPKVQVVRKAAGGCGRRPYILAELEVIISAGEET